MATRFQGDEDSRLVCPCTGLLQCQDFGMCFTGATVPALADDLAVLLDDTADTGIRIATIERSRSKIQRTGHAHMVQRRVLR